jgi:hypothetical protein
MSRRRSFGTSFPNHRHIDGHTKVIAGRADKLPPTGTAWSISPVTATRIKFSPLIVPFVRRMQPSRRPEGRCRVLVGRVLVNRLGLIQRLGRLLLGAHIVVAAVRLRRSPMNSRGLLVMLGGLLLHFLSTPDTRDGSTSR